MAILVVSFALVSRCPSCAPNITNRVVFVAAVPMPKGGVHIYSIKKALKISNCATNNVLWSVAQQKKTHIDYRTIMNMTQNGQNMKKRALKPFGYLLTLG